MKYIKTFEIVTELYKKGDYVLINSVYWKIFNEPAIIFDILEEDTYGCRSLKDEKEFEIEGSTEIVRKLTNKEIEFFKNTKKYNL